MVARAARLRVGRRELPAPICGATIRSAVEDPSVGEDARAGAAWVLRRGLDDAERQRVRVAADATASPELRASLEATLDEAEENMEESLARFTAPDRARRTDR